MAGRCIPAQPAFRSPAEQVAWAALRKRLRDQDVLLHGIRFTGDDGDWEVDLVLLMPEGFATVEVKGGRVWREAGTWRQRTPAGVRTLDLENQSVSGMYLLRRWLTHQPGWTRGWPRMAHLVALPDVDVGPADPSPGLPRRRVLDRGDLRDAAGIIHDILTGPLAQEPRNGPGVVGVDQAADLLGGRGDPQRDVAGLVQVRTDHVARLTEQQYAVLDYTRAVPRYRVVGGPGTGKTWLAVEQARRWARDGARVGLVCYSRGLATWVARQVAGWPRPLRRRVWAGTYHALGVHWGARIPADADPAFWEADLPAEMLVRARALSPEGRFDALVVDEAQDMADSWWPALLASLADPDHGRLGVFADDGQRVFGRTGGPGCDLVPFVLDENLRNTSQIAAAFAPLAPSPARTRGGTGPPVRFVPCRAPSATEAADDEAVALLEEGWAPGDVVLLTTWHRHPVQVERVSARGADGYWETFWDGSDLFYATVPGFKGLERPAAVLAVDGFRSPDVAREILYVGLSRARDLLVVCADPDLIAEVGGPSLLRRLRDGSP